MNDMHTIIIRIIGKQHFHCHDEERIQYGAGWSGW